MTGGRGGAGMTIEPISVEQARTIRRAVLKPGLPGGESVYPGDDAPETIHLGAFESGRLLGIATLLHDRCPVEGRTGDWRLRGMATLAEVRGRGIGGDLLENGVERAACAGAARIWCNGRTRARPFYERHQFRAVGGEFEIPFTGPHYLFVRDLHAG